MNDVQDVQHVSFRLDGETRRLLELLARKDERSMTAKLKRIIRQSAVRELGAEQVKALKTGGHEAARAS